MQRSLRFHTTSDEGTIRIPGTIEAPGRRPIVPPEEPFICWRLEGMVYSSPLFEIMDTNDPVRGVLHK
jgi:hypothetical protein